MGFDGFKLPNAAYPRIGSLKTKGIAIQSIVCNG